MEKNQDYQLVKAISRVLFSDNAADEKCKEQIEAYYKLLLRLSRLNLDAEIAKQDILLPHGLALSPQLSTTSVLDAPRTIKYLKALKQVISHTLKKGCEKPVTLMYAGTGAFASLVIPLSTIFTSDELQFSLLEANTVNISSVKYIFKALNLTDYISDIYQCDASNFKLPEKLQTNTNILLIECLQQNLSKEPQVAIAYNLINQLPDSVIMIPELIQLKVGSFKISEISRAGLFKKDFINMQPARSQTVFSLNVQAIRQKQDVGLRKLFFDENQLDIDDFEREGTVLLGLYTEVYIYKKAHLKLNESGITTPNFLVDIGAEQKVKFLQTQYKLGLNPGLDFKLVDRPF